MSRNADKRRKRPKDEGAPPPPDASPAPARWKYLVLAAVFLAWVAFLIYCGAAGNP
jgi:hypothetical protein